MDYQGNTNKAKEPAVEEKNIEKIIVGEVIQKPKPISRKFKEIFLGGDAKMTMRYVTADVLLPGLRNLIFDLAVKSAERTLFGDSTYRRRPVEYRPRVQYNNPINRMRDPRELSARLPDQPQRPYRTARRDFNDIILADRVEAELVIERLIDIIEKYKEVSLADLYDLLGLPSPHTDNKWGWTYLNNAEVRQVRDGYLIDLPPLEEL
jgi:hypothetical protein